MDFTCVLPSKKPRFDVPKLKNRVPLAELDANVRRSQASAFAGGTLRNLTTQWVRYLTFCIAYDFDPLPGSVQTLCRYAQYLSSCFKSHQTLLCYLSGVKILHKLMGVSIQAFEDVALKFAVKGMGRNNSYVPRQAPPMTPQLLKQIFQLLDFSDEDDTIFWAVLLVGFFLLLRKSNLVPDSASTFDGSKQIKRSDLEFNSDHIKVTLNWLKNKEIGNNTPHRFALPKIPNSVLCPVAALLRVLELVPADSHQSVFVRSDGTCFSYAKLQAKLAKVSEQLGVKKLTSHSLRAGGATNAFLSGVPGELIKILGHWKSDVYLKYLRLPEEARLAAGALVKYRILSLDL